MLLGEIFTAISGGVLHKRIQEGGMKKKWFTLILAIFFVALCFAIYVGAKERLHWYIQQGKGRPLCECLTRIANSEPRLEGIIPNIPWKQVLAIEGVREPEWRELYPLKYEGFFLKARKFKAAKGGYDERVIPFTRWFLPPKERWVDESVRKIPISDKEALKIYRDFVRRGGKMKVFRYDIGDKKQPILRAFVQYESPEKDFSDWDGYTLQAEPDLTGINDPTSLTFGRGYRLLMYKNELFSFVGFRRGYDEYRVLPIRYVRDVYFSHNSPYYRDTYFCKINIKVD